MQFTIIPYTHGADNCDTLKIQFPYLKIPDWQSNCALIDSEKETEQMSTFLKKVRTKSSSDFRTFESLEAFKKFELEYQKAFDRSISADSISDTRLTIGGVKKKIIQNKLKQIVEQTIEDLVVSDWALQNQITHSPGNAAPSPLMISDQKLRASLENTRNSAKQILNYISANYPLEFNCMVFENSELPRLTTSPSEGDHTDLTQFQDLPSLEMNLMVPWNDTERTKQALTNMNNSLQQFGFSRDKTLDCSQKVVIQKKPPIVPSLEECFNKKLSSALSTALKIDTNPSRNGIHSSIVGNENQPCEIITLYWEVKKHKITKFWGRYTRQDKVAKKVNCLSTNIIKRNEKESLDIGECFEEVNSPQTQLNNR